MTADATGDCFIVAAKLVALAGEYPDAFICHGMVTHAETGRHAHAWIERHRTFTHPDWEAPIPTVDVIDRSNGNNAALPAALYYKLGAIDPDTVRRYDRTTAIERMLATGHYGPWTELA
jgi:hypothetical protein